MAPLPCGLLGISLLAGFISSTTACASDNCLRAFRRHLSDAGPFCESLYVGDLTITATTGLPSYATACAGSPSRISSACSCLVTPVIQTSSSSSSMTTRTSTTSTVTVTTPRSVPPSCTPGVLKNSDFSEALGMSFSWQVERTTDGSLEPDWNFEPGTPNYFSVDFPDPTGKPFLANVTLFQTDISVCNGWNEIDFSYMTTLQNYTGAAPLIDIASSTSNCTITAGLTNVTSNTVPLPWDSQLADAGAPNNWLYFNAILDSTALPAEGLVTTFFLTVACPNATWWPRVMVKEPNFARPF